MRPIQYIYQIIAAVVVAITAGIVFGSSAAYAEEITVSGEVSPTLTDWREAAAVPQFDPAQGELTRVEVQITASLTGSASLESLDAQPSVIELVMSSQIDLLGTDGNVLISAMPTADASRSLAAFDGGRDFEGPSGAQIPSAELLGFDESSLVELTDPAELERFIGAGDVNIVLVATANSAANGAGNIQLRFETLTSATLQVTYFYESGAFPCPAESLPRLQFMGETGTDPGVQTQFSLEGDFDGFDGFIVKQNRPFELNFTEGETSEFGIQTLAVGPQLVRGVYKPTRVYACAGDCDLNAIYRESFLLGEEALVAGQEVNLAFVDDDRDSGFQFFYRSEDLAQLGESASPTDLPEEEKIPVVGTLQQFVDYVRFLVPSDGNWNFYAADSVGLVQICVDEPVEAAAVDGRNRAVAWRYGSYGDMINDIRQRSHQLFLPIIQ